MCLCPISNTRCYKGYTFHICSQFRSIFKAVPQMCEWKYSVVCKIKNELLLTHYHSTREKKGFNCSFNKDLTVYYCDMCVMSLFVYFNIPYRKATHIKVHFYGNWFGGYRSLFVAELVNEIFVCLCLLYYVAPYN